MPKHPLARPAPTVDMILRSRVAALLRQQRRSVASAATAAGWSTSTLHRRLHLDSANSDLYRRLHLGDIDQLLGVLELPAEAVLSPVLSEQDRELLVWVGERTPADPLRSRAAWSDLTAKYPELVEPLYAQGLLAVCGEPDDPATWYARLTPTAQRALR